MLGQGPWEASRPLTELMKAVCLGFITEPELRGAYQSSQIVQLKVTTLHRAAVRLQPHTMERDLPCLSYFTGLREIILSKPLSPQSILQQWSSACHTTSHNSRPQKAKNKWLRLPGCHFSRKNLVVGSWVDLCYSSHWKHAKQARKKVMLKYFLYEHKRSWTTKGCR